MQSTAAHHLNLYVSDAVHNGCGMSQLQASWRLLHTCFACRGLLGLLLLLLLLLLLWLLLLLLAFGRRLWLLLLLDGCWCLLLLLLFGCLLLFGRLLLLGCLLLLLRCNRLLLGCCTSCRLRCRQSGSRLALLAVLQRQPATMVLDLATCGAILTSIEAYRVLGTAQHSCPR